MTGDRDEPTRRAVLLTGATATAIGNSPLSAATFPELRVLDAAQAIDLERSSSAERWEPHKLNLTPARWIWLPCGRVLPNTFVLFRREINLPAKPLRATALITADSRYRLTANGQRAGWGPAPSDPRQLDVDPIDLTPLLRKGINVLGAEVLFYGTGDGTWAGGKPGFLFHLIIDLPDGERQVITSDDQWLTYLDRAHAPGKPKRWFLRALQEEFDARRHPEGWNKANFHTDDLWLPAQAASTPADKPTAAGTLPFWSGDTIDRANPARSSLQAALAALVECPPELGLSYPCNANWRYWALGKLGRADVVIQDLRQRWAVMPSVILNNTLQENWSIRADSTAQWSHSALAPLFILFMDIAGIRATAPGFTRCQIRPQLGDIGQLSLTAHTVRGPIHFAARAERDGHEIRVSLPAGCDGEILVPRTSTVPLHELTPPHPLGLKRYRLEHGGSSVFLLRTHTK